MERNTWLKYRSTCQQQEDIDESKLPSFGLVVTIILIPLVLIILDSLAGVVGFLTPVAGILGFLGEPFVALLIATLVAMYCPWNKTRLHTGRT